MARELLDKGTKTIIINEDNRAAALWTRQNSHQSKTKQIEISFHHIRDEVAKNRIKIEPVCSSYEKFGRCPDEAAPKASIRQAQFCHLW